MKISEGQLVVKLTVSVVFSTFSLCKFIKLTQSKFRTINLTDVIQYTVSKNLF